MSEIAYVGQDDQVYVSQPDGSASRLVSRPHVGLTPESGWTFRWPTYSPDGRRLAFAGYLPRGRQPARAAVLTADLDPPGAGARALLASTQLAPIYLYWAPDSRRLTVLVQHGNTPSLELLLLDPDRDAPSPLVRGQPLYWAW